MTTRRQVCIQIDVLDRSATKLINFRNSGWRDLYGNMALPLGWHQADQAEQVESMLQIMMSSPEQSAWIDFTIDTDERRFGSVFRPDIEDGELLNSLQALNSKQLLYYLLAVSTVQKNKMVSPLLLAHIVTGEVVPIQAAAQLATYLLDGHNAEVWSALVDNDLDRMNQLLSGVIRQEEAPTLIDNAVSLMIAANSDDVTLQTFINQLIQVPYNNNPAVEVRYETEDRRENHRNYSAPPIENRLC